MKSNSAAKSSAVFTHEGAKAYHVTDAQALNRSVMSCMLFESEFYENGEDIADRIASLIPKVTPETVAGMAIKARTDMNLRHVPLLLCVEMAKHASHRGAVENTVFEVIQRADELAEILAIYQKRNGHKNLKKLANSIKRGLAQAFHKFDEYQLAKYNRDNEIKLRDVLFLCHAKPKNVTEKRLWKRLVEKELKTPDTWEVAISAAKGDKDATLKEWLRLIKEEKLGGLALLRNLRNMREAGVPENKIAAAIVGGNYERVLPFRFISAAAYNPTLEPYLEPAMIKCLGEVPKLKGRNCIVIDHSGSMDAKLSAKSDLTRFDAACALAILLREISEKFGCVAFSDAPVIVPPRRGFALRDAIRHSMPSGGTNTEDALKVATKAGYERIIVITDEQSHQAISAPFPGSKAYFINVASAKNGIGYGKWLHVDGFSESIIKFIQTYERETA